MHTQNPNLHTTRVAMTRRIAILLSDAERGDLASFLLASHP